jgi:MFS family permease
VATVPQAAGRGLVTSAYSIPFVIGASAVGTVIEWYDFYLYATLTPFLAPIFFPPGDATGQLLSAFAVYGAGFAVRPFGAIVFGRIGDVVGRKYAFLLTVSIMGGATVLVGVLPGYAQIGVLAPLILVIFRLLQGLALGGEYGGAAIYVAEHAPDDKRGLYTAWIQTTATLGFFFSLAVILLTRVGFGEATYAAWGWRVPFLFSAVLVGFAVWIRLKLQETPLFQRLKDSGETTKDTGSWARDSFGGNKVGVILLVLFGMTAGQAVVWYQGQFQALNFLTIYLKTPYQTAYTILMLALVFGTPLFLFFGWLSDRVGRKPIILGGCLLAAITYVPIYQAMVANANVTLDAAGKITAANPNILVEAILVWIQVVFVTMVYGPIAAFLVEFFPAKVRYTSLSIPYHLGNGEFGGWLPLLYTGIVAATVAGAGYTPWFGVFDLRGFNATNDPNGNIYAGLAYTIIVALMTAIIGWFWIPETRHRKIWEEVGGETAGVGAPAIP